MANKVKSILLAGLCLVSLAATAAPQHEDISILSTYDLSSLKAALSDPEHGNAALIRTKDGVFCVAAMTGKADNASLMFDCNWNYFNELHRNKMTGQWRNGVSPFLP